LDKYADKERTTKTHLVDFEKNTLGFYLRDELTILPSLILAGGYRTESAQFKGKSTTLSPFSTDFDAEKKHNAEAWEGSLTYLFGKMSKAYVKYASVYRYPFLDEQASFYSSGPFNTFNMNIEKERGKSYEVGTVVYPLDNLKLGLTLYRIDMEDEISADPVTWELKNLDKTRHVGGEFNFNYVQKGFFSFCGNATYQKAIFVEGLNQDKEVPLVPNFMANANLEINLPFNIFLNPRLHYVGKSFLANDYDNNAEQLKDYLRWDFFIYWRPEIKGKKIVAFIGVENLTDEKYATYGLDLITTWGLDNIYYPADGLIIKGGVSVTF
jgi:iron complex outermembrane receptor protein